MQKTWVQHLCQEDPLEKGPATHSSIRVWRISMNRGAWQAQSMGSQRVRYDWTTNISRVYIVYQALSQMPSMYSHEFMGNLKTDLLGSQSRKCHDLEEYSVQSVQSFSRVWLFATTWNEARQAFLSITNSQSLLKLLSIKPVMISNHFILCRPLLLLPSILPNIRVFSNESVLHTRWPKYWSFSFSISPSYEYSRQISFRTDCLDIFAVQGTLKSLLQHHSSKASIFCCSAFFMVQLSHPYSTTVKTIALTRQTFVCLCFLICCLGWQLFFQRAGFFSFHGWSHHLQWFGGSPKIKFVTVSIVSPSVCHVVMGRDAISLVFWILSFKPAFSLSSFIFIKRLFSSSSLLL